MINTSNFPWNNLTYFDLGYLEIFHKTMINIWIVFIIINRNLLGNLYLKMLHGSNTHIGFSEVAAEDWTHRYSINADGGMTSFLPRRQTLCRPQGF